MRRVTRSLTDISPNPWPQVEISENMGEDDQTTAAQLEFVSVRPSVKMHRLMVGGLFFWIKVVLYY